MPLVDTTMRHRILWGGCHEEYASQQTQQGRAGSSSPGIFYHAAKSSTEGSFMHHTPDGAASTIRLA